MKNEAERKQAAPSRRERQKAEWGGFWYERPDYRAGLDGGWYHEDCEAEDSDGYTQETWLEAEREPMYRGMRHVGWVDVTPVELTCQVCGAKATVELSEEATFGDIEQDNYERRLEAQGLI